MEEARRGQHIVNVRTYLEIEKGSTEVPFAARFRLFRSGKSANSGTASWESLEKSGKIVILVSSSHRFRNWDA
jgi:hypothetical protein